MRVMAINPPGRQNSLSEPILTGRADVIHDLIAPIFNDGGANPSGDVIKRAIPIDTLPFSLAPLSRSLQREENPIRISNLIDRGWPFGTVSSTRSRVLGVAFELLNCTSVFVDISEQPARRLTVKASGRDELIVPLLAPGPCLRIQLGPVVPAGFRRQGSEMDAARAG